MGSSSDAAIFQFGAFDEAEPLLDARRLESAFWARSAAG